jgi:O-antigen/teichoic acid export membrane protein
MPTSATRIAKNTLMLYFRQILIMLVSLYTVQVVLNTLGAEDYGIYNVVAGVVTMFGFLSNSMAGASQRYFSFEIGRGDFEQLKKVFSLNLAVYILLAIVVLILAETIGLWFVGNKLLIPMERKKVALFVYHFMVISFLFTILTGPYMALIISHEDMNIYAYIAMVEAALKLGVVWALSVLSWDKLKVYGVLLCIVAVTNSIIYRIVCFTKYRECRFKFYRNKKLFIEIVNYTAFNMIGAIAVVIKNQATTILLNQFFGSVIVASRGIALMVNGSVSNFSANFYTAVKPQIIKSYATEQNKEMLFLVFLSAKGIYFLMYVFVLPLVLEIPYILLFWLKQPPPYTDIFIRLLLLDALAGSLTVPMGAIAQATGKIRLYQLVANGILLLNLPIAWVVLQAGAPPYSVMIVSVFFTFAAQIIQIFIVGRLVDFPVWIFVKNVVLKLLFISAASAVIPCITYAVLRRSFARLCVVTLVSFSSICGCMYLFCFDKTERRKIKGVIVDRLRRLHSERSG